MRDMQVWRDSIASWETYYHETQELIEAIHAHAQGSVHEGEISGPGAWRDGLEGIIQMVESAGAPLLPERR